MSIDAIQIKANKLKTAINQAQHDIKPIVTALIFASAVVIALYGLNFRNLPISTDPNDWAEFGDFIGGIVNPI